ncbi:hypothetical protein BS78_01G410400 [Paspalum vaginatum]|nr:hypothetical protein BS78_01G410400 [Paspalum vaginatum]
MLAHPVDVHLHSSPPARRSLLLRLRGLRAAAALVLTRSAVGVRPSTQPGPKLNSMVRGERAAAGGLVGPWLLIAVLVHSSLLGSTVFTAVDAARMSAFVVKAPELPMAPAPSPAAANALEDSKRPVPTGSNPLHNR